jgi:hypothetical protein
MHGLIINFVKTRNLAVFFLVLIGVFYAGAVNSEGGCPPGFYPVGGQGVQGCAPIPRAGVEVGGARPTGRWIKTWGAIAVGGVDGKGDVGIAIGKRSKRSAVEEAMDRCSEEGADDCEVVLTYKNQCAAIATASNGVSRSIFGRSRSIERASENAINLCRSGGSGECEIIHVNCSEPVFDPF